MCMHVFINVRVHVFFNLKFLSWQEDEDLEATAASIAQCEPYILAVGYSVQDLLQFAVVAERQIVTEPASVLGTMLDLTH